MKYMQLEDRTFVMRLDPGDDVHRCIQQCFEENGFKSGFFWGVGSVDSPVLAHYKITKKQYSEIPMSGVFEVTSLSGSAAQLDGKMSLHVHVTISDEEMKAYGGHLVKGKVSATMELKLKGSKTELKKVRSDKIGLNIWDF